MDKLQAAWTAFPPDVASEYLKTFLHPSKESLEVLTDILQSYQGSEPLSLLDLGCGNAQMYEYFKEAGLRCRYVGVDLRGPLLDAAHRATQGDPNVSLIETDVNTLQGVGGSYDFAIYSHVLEILASPEQSLQRARSLAKAVIIRFFEPPEFEFDTVELREMPVDTDGTTVPYLRRKMGRDYYRLILARLGCTQVDVYRDGHKDQVHVLHYPASNKGQ